MRLTLLLCLLPGALIAQSADTARNARTIPVTDSVLRLPVDRASDLLPWMAGGGLDRAGAPAWHGVSAAFLDRETDGIRWATGLRLPGMLGEGPATVLLEPGLNAIGSGVIDPVGGGPATLRFTTLGGGDRWESNGSAESGAPFKPEGGMGFSRLEGMVGGPLKGSFRLRASGSLLGREAASGGVGYPDAPFYAPTGIDTTMRFVVGPDSIDAPVQRFGVATKVPYSPRSTVDWTIRLDGRLGTTQLWARWLGAQTGERTFNYLDIANPLQARGVNTSARDIAVGFRTPLIARITVDGSLALQHERSERGPLASTAESDSRDPLLGLLLGGLDLRWSMDNFPVDATLLSNYRNNTLGSRRSPYDLENTAQYQLIDQYRNDAYGLLGWSESGGPVGQLAFFDDARILGRFGVILPAGAGGTVRFGVEMTHHDAKYYAHGLVTQSMSNVWLEQPTEGALTAEWTRRGNGWSAEAGARLDRFRSGASRMYLLDTLSFSPDVGRYLFFPRISSYGNGAPTLQHPVADDSHTAFAPHIDVQGDMGGGLIGHVSLARTVRMPDLAFLFAGLNADITITGSAAPFGTDLGHEVADLIEFGISKRTGAVTLGATVFHDQLHHLATATFTTLVDPANGGNTNVLLATLKDGGAYQGVTLSGDWQAASWFRARGAYTYTDTTEEAGSPFASLGTAVGPRPHSLALSAEAAGPSGSAFEGLSGLLSFRVMSGAAEGIVVGFNPPYPTRTKDIPAWSSLDLRVAKQIAWGTRALTIYFDGRNLLNAKDIRRAFNDGTPYHGTGTEAQTWSGDSASYAVEAANNGLYDGAGSIDLTFGGAGRGGCGTWQTASGTPAPPNCAYLIGAERTFGDGDGIFTVAEQQRASDSYYRSTLGAGAFNGPTREVRLGMRIGF